MTEGPFYLEPLLFCCVPMAASPPRRVGRDRTYLCTGCGRRVDALAAEVQVWELATRERPDLGHSMTPYERRREILAAALNRVRYLPNAGVYDSFRLKWS